MRYISNSRMPLPYAFQFRLLTMKGEHSMNRSKSEKTVSVFLIFTLLMNLLSGCFQAGQGQNLSDSGKEEQEPDISQFLSAIEDEPDTVDFQCTTIHYTIAENVFNRLVESTMNQRGELVIVPSLAQSWNVSEDGKTYQFHLREGIQFTNGSPLTASDVGYTMVRLLTHPHSSNSSILEMVEGADELMEGKTDTLKGFTSEGDYDFTITLIEPFEAFLACLSMPGASILDEETTVQAGDRFGHDPEWTIGTGPFILWKWTPGEGYLLKANQDCWEGPPNCAGLDLKFMSDPGEIRTLFEEGGLDILDLDEVGSASEYFIHGDIYQNCLHRVNRIALTYIALNESIAPLNDVRVRKALQLALNRKILLEAVYGGEGRTENGIIPIGLYGFNPDLPEIPYDPEAAKELLREAGYPNGLRFTISVRSSSTQWEMVLLRLVVSMWEKVGVNARISVISDDEFMSLRKSGKIACYSATWSADFNDPDNFFYTFFGTPANTLERSLCYARPDIISRVRLARQISDSQQRIEEYRDLEEIIVQEDAAWIPLFSRRRFYVTSGRVRGFQSDWSGSVKNVYRLMSVENDAEELR